MAKALWFGVSFAIGVMAGGILLLLILSEQSAIALQKNAERDAQYEMHAEEDQTGTFENRE